MFPFCSRFFNFFHYRYQ